MKKQTTLIFFFCLLILFKSKAQSCLNASDIHGRIGNISFDASIGEMTLISTENANSFSITQGFLQPYPTQQIPSQSQLNTSNYSIQVYPNPTQDFVNIKLNIFIGTPISIYLTNTVGQLLIQKSLVSTSESFSYPIDISSYSEGEYFLKIIYENEKHIQKSNSFKIQKINP